MKASEYRYLSSQMEDMSDKQKAIIFQFLVGIALKSPELLFSVIKVLVRIGKIIAETFFDKDGKPRDPWWVRVLGVFGINFARKIQEIGNEADQTLKELNLPDVV